MSEGKFLSEAELEHLLIEANVTETEIMQYADGALAPERWPAVRTALAEHPELMQILESFLFTRGRMAEAFNGVFLQAPPEQLLPRQKTAEPPPARRRRRLFGFPRPNLPPFGFRFRTPVIAAFAALAAVVLTAWLMNQRINAMEQMNRQLSQRMTEMNQANQQMNQRMNHMVRDFIPPDKQGVAAPPLLQQALEVTPMGMLGRVNEHLSVKPLLTFFTRLQIWCREFGLVYGGNVLWQGQLACRGNDGVWRVRDTTDQLLPRGVTEMVGEDAQGVLARARDNLKVGDVIGPEEEANLIKKGWQGKP